MSKIIIHANYTGLTGKRKSTKNADIALIKLKQPIVLGDYAWPICYFDSEEEEKAGLLELRTASKTVKKSLGTELNYKNNEFVEHQLTDDEQLEENYFSILDESNCESYNQYDSSSPAHSVNNDSNYLDNRNRTADRSAWIHNSSTNSIKYPPTSNLPNFIADDETHALSTINITKLTKLANLVLVVGWGKKHEKADHYSSYLQKSTLCLIPNSGRFHHITLLLPKTKLIQLTFGSYSLRTLV